MRRKKKSKVSQFFSGPFLWFSAICGVLLLGYGMWFQTEGFTIIYTSFYNCFVVVMFGVILGTLLMRYLKKQTLPDPNKPMAGRISRAEVGSMMIGFEICLYACMMLLYIATNLIMFYATIAVGSLCIFCFWYFLIWGFFEEKKAKNAN